jgi:hypothetical protein
MLVINTKTTIKTIQESQEQIVIIDEGASSEQISNLSPDFAKIAILSANSPVDAIQALPVHIDDVRLNIEYYNLDAKHITLEQARAIPQHVCKATKSSLLSDPEVMATLLGKGIKISVQERAPINPAEVLVAENLNLRRDNAAKDAKIASLQEEVKHLREAGTQHASQSSTTKSDYASSQRMFPRPVIFHLSKPQDMALFTQPSSMGKR